MPLPTEPCSALAIDIEALLKLKLSLPGGADISLKIEPGTIPDFGAMVNEMLKMINPALTPLAPIFNIIDTVLTIFECIKAIPDSLGPPPDPTKIAKCIGKLAQKVDFLLKLVPQISIALFIKSLVDMVVAVLAGLRDALKAILKQQVKINIAIDKAAQLGGAPLLEANIACAQSNLEAQLQVSFASMKPVASLIGLLNLFLQLAGLDPLPSIEMSAGLDATGALEPLDKIITTIQQVSSKLPSG